MWLSDPYTLKGNLPFSYHILIWSFKYIDYWMENCVISHNCQLIPREQDIIHGREAIPGSACLDQRKAFMEEESRHRTTLGHMSV